MHLLRRAARVVVSRHPTASAGVAVVAAVALLWVALPSRTSPSAPSTTQDDDDLDLAEPLPPRAILGRAWFDKYPEKRRDSVKLWFWLGGGIAFHESGSSYRVSLELFEFERQNDRLTVTALQDKKTTTTAFKIEACDERPFNVCLTFDESPRGPKKYYGFARRADQERYAPWATGIERAAEERAKTLPRD